jgi:uncharacterized protein YrrD
LRDASTATSKEGAMLRSFKQFKGYAIEAVDDRIGSVKDVYFDDQQHTVRYLIVDTGGWLTGRRVLIPPPAVKGVDEQQRTVHVSLTRKQVEDSPSIDEDKPVSRQHEADVFGYYGYPVYWTGPYLWGVGAFPMLGAGAAHPPVYPANPSAGPEVLPPAAEERDEHADTHLRSAEEVIGYTVGATDGELGHIADFLIDDRDWSVRQIVVDTAKWWAGKHVPISVESIETISWGDRTVFVKLTREQIREQPEVEV